MTVDCSEMSGWNSSIFDRAATYSTSTTITTTILAATLAIAIAAICITAAIAALNVSDDLHV